MGSQPESKMKRSAGHGTEHQKWSENENSRGMIAVTGGLLKINRRLARSFTSKAMLQF